MREGVDEYIFKSEVIPDWKRTESIFSNPDKPTVDIYVNWYFHEWVGEPNFGSDSFRPLTSCASNWFTDRNEWQPNRIQ